MALGTDGSSPSYSANPVQPGLACPTPTCQHSLSWHPSGLQTTTHVWHLCKSGKMCGRDTGLLEPPLGVVLQDSSPITRWTLSGGGWRQNKMLKNKMATCEFETCLGYESLSQKAQKAVARWVTGRKKSEQASSPFCLIHQNRNPGAFWLLDLGSSFPSSIQRPSSYHPSP